MRPVLVTVVAALLVGCDIDSDFNTYCSVTGRCHCSGDECCSVSACGEGSLSCCSGMLCQNGQCIQDVPVLTFSQSKIDFGRIPVLAQTPAVSFELTNSGSLAADSEITVHVSSGESSDFGVDTSTCPAKLAPGGSCTAQIRLTPAALGAKQATLSTAGTGSPCLVTGIFGLQVQVDLLGTQLTSIQSSPSGLVCSGAKCAAYFAEHTALSLSVSLPYGVTWGPPCETTGDACGFTVNADTQVTATIQPPLVIEVVAPGFSSGSVEVEPGAVICGGRCELAISGEVTLTALARRGDPPGGVNATIFQGWTGACAGSGPVCTLNVSSPIETSVTLSNLNLAFLTGPVPLLTLGADGSGADAVCNSTVSAGSPQNYIAWLATSTRNPAQLLAAYTGWSPTQGPDVAVTPTAPSVSDITSARLWSPIECPECGTGGLGPANIITGANPDGSSLSASDNCQDWTASTGSAPVGSVGGMGYGWSVDLGASRIPCTGSALLACFGANTSGVVLTVSPSAFYAQFPNYGLMFLSSPWVPANGVAGGDSHCQSDAIAAGLYGTFVAAGIDGSAKRPSHFVRTDGAYNGFGIASPSNVDALGDGVIPSVLSDTYVWKQGTDENCNDWTGGPGTFGPVTRFDVPLLFSLPPVSCTEAHRLYCYQVE
jgi:hypothetical protein